MLRDYYKDVKNWNFVSRFSHDVDNRNDLLIRCDHVDKTNYVTLDEFLPSLGSTWL